LDGKDKQHPSERDELQGNPEYGEHPNLEGLLNKLRAAVLGANDGIVSVAGAVIGVAAAGSGRDAVAVAGVAALVAGAISMAGGEYASVAAQRDAERGYGKREHELMGNPIAAAVASFLAFSVGGVLPLLAMLLTPTGFELGATVLIIVVALAGTGLFAARAGKSSPWIGIRRNVGVSIITMGLSYLVGLLLGATVLG
jgi:vacuolar iron transporter family protein